MGGYGSGRWDRYDAKRTVETCLTIDVNRLNRENLLVPGTYFVQTWQNEGESTVVISVLAASLESVLHHEFVHFFYTPRYPVFCTSLLAGVEQ